MGWAGLLLALSVQPALAAEAMRNGGFDSGGLDQWYFQAQLGGVGTGEAVTTPHKEGTQAAHLTVTTAQPDSVWKVQLGQYGAPLVSGQVHRITFWAKADAARTINLSIQQGSDPYDTYYDADVALTTTWTKYALAFKPNATTADTLFNFNVAQATGQVWIDSVSMIPTASTVAGPVLTIDSTVGRHAINPDIYGMNFVDHAATADLGISVDRWGGDTMDTYNWQLGSANLSQNYYWENISDCLAFDVGCDGGNAPFYPTFIQRDLDAGIKTLITLPLMGYVAKTAPTAHPFTCSFPRAQFPDQDSFDPYDTRCGSGVTGGGVELTTSPATSYKAITSTFDGNFVGDIVARFGRASAGGVKYYALGNEPALWSSTHRDAHPQRTTFDELGQKTIDTAVAVKRHDPSAKVLAFSEWAYPNYLCSDADDWLQGCDANSPDRAAHGGATLVEWLLQQWHDHDVAAGRRFIDYLDLHYYPQGGDTLDITRSLWDPTYVDPSYIGENFAAKIHLIPQMRAWVAANYPGTKIAITEYNFSHYGEPRFNALKQADVLGIFARERLDLATRWSLDQDGEGADLQGIYDAFRLYRNYDGAGAHFGETFVRSASGNQSRLAIYGAQRTADGKLTIVLINKTANVLNSKLTFNGAAPTGNAEVWRWEGAGIVRQADAAIAGTMQSYPPLSMTLYVVPVQ
jgi:hypothetical protein